MSALPAGLVVRRWAPDHEILGVQQWAVHREQEALTELRPEEYVDEYRTLYLAIKAQLLKELNDGTTEDQPSR